MNFDLSFIEGEIVKTNGKIERRVVLTIDGQQKEAARLVLDDPATVRTAAARLAEDYGLDVEAVLEKLRELALEAIGDIARKHLHAKEQQARLADLPRVSELADDFLKELRPVWHRKRQTIYLEKLKAEIPVGQLWKEANDDVIDAVGNTADGEEMTLRGKPPDYRRKTGLFKDAIQMAAARAIRSLPDVKTIEKDPTIDARDLQTKLEAWLLQVRSFSSENGVTIRKSYFAWAIGLEPSKGWQQCYASPVFALIKVEGQMPTIAAHFSALLTELRYESDEALTNALKAHKLATAASFKLARKKWRVWNLEPHVLEAIATPDAEIEEGTRVNPEPGTQPGTSEGVKNGDF